MPTVELVEVTQESSLPTPFVNMKPERGYGFNLSECQAAFPTRAALTIKEDSQTYTKLPLKEEGRPLVCV